MAGDFFAGGASAALPGAVPQAAVPSGAGQTANPQVQVLQKLASSGLLSPEALEHMVSFGGQPPTPQAPVRAESPDIQYAKPQGSFGSVGERKRADEQALFHGIASTIKTAANYIQDKQVRSMQMDTERLMSAMRGLNEAQASGNAEALKHNSEIINSMLDPSTSEGKKRIKSFQKVFNVNLLGEGKGKDTPEYKGFVGAFQKYKQDKASGLPAVNPIAQRLMQQIPQRAQADPRLQALMEATKAGVVPKAADQLKAQTEVFKIMTAAQEKGYDRESKENIAKLLSESKDKATQASIVRTVLQNTGRQGVAEIMSNASKYRADMTYKGIMDSPKWGILRDKLAKSGSEDKGLINLFNMVDKQIKEVEVSKKQADKLAKTEYWWQHEGADKVKDYAAQVQHLHQLQNLIITDYSNKHPDDPVETLTKEEDQTLEVDYTPEEQTQLDEILK